ncbi:MAG TPA: serine hydrolase, partial [Pyrinomonadaceae bacterium]|nr:serine hydrolase [Pyrinomonadaceae bacterium]
MKIPIVFFLFATLFVSAMHAQTDRFTAFRENYLKELRDAGIVGSSFMFLKDGKTVSEIHHGSANLAKSQPVKAGTIYHWASNTKP